MTQVIATLADTGLPSVVSVPGPRSAVRELSKVESVSTSTLAGRRIARWVRPVGDVVACAVVALVVGTQVGLTTPLIAVAVFGWPLLLLAGGHYRRHPLGESGAAGSRRVLVAGVRAFMLAAAGTPFLAGTTDVGALLWLAVALTATSLALALVLPVRSRARLVLTGHPGAVRAALAELTSAGHHEVVALCLTRRTSFSFGDLPSYVGADNVRLALTRHHAQAVVVFPGRDLPPVSLRRLQWDAAGVGAELYLGTGLVDVHPQRTRVVTTPGLDALHVAAPVLAGPRRLVKDVVERGLALIGLLVIVPLLLVVAVLIRRESPGPVLFRQQRIGRDGAPFTMLKFRSMRFDADEQRAHLTALNECDGALFKIRQDPRVTRLGAVLRQYSLDELPQLWNVVRGDMSLVGPRPALPGEVAGYGLDPRRRLVVKPGVTGLWQVSGRSDLSWEQSVRLDLRYVDNWSLALDLSILRRTVGAVLGHRGAY